MNQWKENEERRKKFNKEFEKEMKRVKSLTDEERKKEFLKIKLESLGE